MVILTCSNYIPDSEWYKDEGGTLYIQKIGKPETRKLYTGVMEYEFGGRDDELVKESTSVKDGKLDGTQILFYSNGLRIENIYDKGALISTKKLKESLLKFSNPFNLNFSSAVIS